MSDDVWEKLAALAPGLGGFDDIVVGQTLEKMDAILEGARLSWFDVAERLRQAPAPKETPPVRNNASAVTSGRPPGRQPSQWLIDKHDVTKAYSAREEADDWTAEFIESLYDQVVHKGFKLSEKQRLILDAKMDKLGV